MGLVGLQVKRRMLRPHGISSLTVSSCETGEVCHLHRSCPRPSSIYSINKSIGREGKQALVLCFAFQFKKCNGCSVH